MPRAPTQIVGPKVAAWRAAACLALPCLAAGCATTQRSAQGAEHVAVRGAAAGAETFDVAYHGVGGAVRAPFRDFNLLRARIPAALKQAMVAPYDTTGLKDCEALGEEIAALDLALGPDLDTPDVERSRDIYGRGAGLAADAALDAMRSAAVGYIPMRTVIRRISGADALEKKARRAVLAGSVRRGFLKALGLERGCPWPASPLGAPLHPAALQIAAGGPVPTADAPTAAPALAAVAPAAATGSAPVLASSALSLHGAAGLSGGAR